MPTRACRRDLLERLRADGPLPASAPPDSCQVPWRSSGWTDNKNVQQLLQLMAQRGEVAVMEGVRGGWRVDPTLLDTPFEGRTALLSPLDRLVSDRLRMAQLVEFDYQLEMFKPAATRRWGYGAMPILHGDHLVGKLDATADREEGPLAAAGPGDPRLIDRSGGQPLLSWSHAPPPEEPIASTWTTS